MKTTTGSIILIDQISFQKSLSRDILICGIGVLFMSLMAKLSVYLPFTPVPITGQSLGILIMGASFGMKRAFYTSLSYILLGSLGIPVFSGTKVGLAALMGPTGGYLIGFVIASVVMGYFSNFKADRKFKTAFPLFLLGHLIIFSCGLLWLSRFIGFSDVFAKGLFPFLPGALVKTLLAGFFSHFSWKAVEYFK